jgi:DNA-binding SARP family transcriptional activator
VEEVEFRVLGPFEVWVEGRALELKRRKQRALLALLLLHAGEVVSTDRLIEDLWAGKPLKSSVGSLQNLISDLRKALGPDVVRTRPPGYVLDIEQNRVDLHRFELLVAQAGEAVDAQRRADLLREALGLWRGPPLADLAFESFANVEVARLEELRTAAREELIGAELELGRHAQAVPELEALVAEHPLRERLRGQLMLALYRSGRQAEALEAYRDARETLVDGLGIEPSPALQQLEQAMLRHDSQLDLAVPTTAPAEPAVERRKTVTVLFTDIVGSTSLAAGLDPEVLRPVMRRYFDTVRTLVERHGGTVEKYVGDAAMAVFGIPQLHEDDALRAVRTARDLGVALVALNSELERDHGVAIQIRTGINTGEVLAGSEEPFATGAAVMVAIRLHAAALPGETLIGEATRSLIGEAATSEPVEQIDDAALGRVRAFRLLELGEDGARRQSLARFVGRTQELARLRGVFEAVRAERRSRVVVVIGDAGIGKTRLTCEFVDSLGDEAQALTGHCVSYGEGATYLPLREIVKQVAPTRPQATISGLLEGDEHAALIALRMAELAGEAEGSPPTGELFWAIRRFFETLAAERPVVVVLEDLHWGEPTLIDLIDYLAAWTADAPVVFLCIARPELLDSRPGWNSTMETVSLEPLSEAETTDLLGELARDRPLPVRTGVRIVEAADGNALFLEQLLAFVTDDVGVEALEEAIPSSIEALLASRLDRLEPEDRSLLERAAVVGKDFPRGAVRHLTPPDALVAVDDRLGKLVRKGLIHARRSRGSAEDAFRFHHVLVRDVTYAGLTKERRAELHERHAAWLEQRREADELVGYHAEQAYKYRRELMPGDPELGRLASWAGQRLTAAGIRAWRHADTPATMNLLRRGVDLLPSDSSERIDALCELGVAQMVFGDFQASEATLVNATEAASEARDPHSALRARIELAHLHLFSDPEGASAELLTLAEQAVPIFEELGDDRALGRTWRHVGYARSLDGKLGEWQVAVERALVHYRRSGWSASGCLGDLGSALFYGPTAVAEALERCDDLLGEATDRTGRASLLAFMGGLEGIDGRLDSARSRLTESATTYEEIGEDYARASYSGRVLGRIEMLCGNALRAGHVLEECCATFERMQDTAGLSTVAAEVADALYAQGRYEEAANWLDLSQQRAASDDVSAQWSWRRTRAKLLARAGAFGEAEATAAEAVRLASGTDALSDHGAVLLDLAEVLRLAGHPQEAAARVEEARQLFERKGNRLSAEAAQTKLSELTVARP